MKTHTTNPRDFSSGRNVPRPTAPMKKPMRYINPAPHLWRWLHVDTESNTVEELPWPTQDGSEARS
jgi:hypothetical protein